MARVTKEEIESAVELYVNSIYDNGDGSDWCEASWQTWLDAVYEELVTWKTDGYGSYWHSNENRFVGKDKLMKKIEPILRTRLEELRDEGYHLKAI